MSKPIAVLISDIHYNLQTLPLADDATRQAIHKANELRVPLIVAGDLHDHKASFRAECMNAMLETFSLCKTDCYIMRGNHCSINEKSEETGLKFLDSLHKVTLVTNYKHIPETIEGTDIHLLAYHSDTAKLKAKLKTLVPGIIIMHQGLQGSESGEYIQDRTALTKKDVSGLRIISGHYHKRQTTRLQNGGEWDYVGNPYTLNFGEANDPEKGFQVLYEYGNLEFVPTNLRKHVVIEAEVDADGSQYNDHKAKKGDLVWVKARGSKEDLARVDKEYARNAYDLEDIDSFKLDLIPTISAISPPKKSGGQPELLDSIIDQLDATEDRRNLLKQTWKDMK